MEKTRYLLYGAAVQGIQDFIFRTDKLKEIVGASELVKEICDELFRQTVGEAYKDECCILHAAGNIKYKFTDESVCRAVVHEFPKVVQNAAPGITLSQAVVPVDDEPSYSKAVIELERRLHIQRNKPTRNSQLGLMGIERSRQTGLPVTEIRNKQHLDASTIAKLYKNGEDRRHTTSKLCQEAFGIQSIKSCQVPWDIEDMTNKNSWVAVIHADGNGLGQVVGRLGTDADSFRNFSEKLDQATKAAAVTAFHQVEKNATKEKGVIAIRPVVLGGDDLTVICRADLALDYTEAFLRAFEEKTREHLGHLLLKNGVFPNGEVHDCLTACAGIAYIKDSFPFHFAASLAESLCTYAKKDAKRSPLVKNGQALPASCLMFHKLQDSFFDDYKDVAKRELLPNESISFQYGPYYLNPTEGRWTISHLLQQANKLSGNEESAIKTHLRQWLSQLYEEGGTEGVARQTLDRLKSIKKEKECYVNVVTAPRATETKNVMAYPTYDILAIHTINTQEIEEE